MTCSRHVSCVSPDGLRSNVASRGAASLRHVLEPLRLKNNSNNECIITLATKMAMKIIHSNSRNNSNTDTHDSSGKSSRNGNNSDSHIKSGNNRVRAPEPEGSHLGPGGLTVPFTSPL